MVNWPNPKHRNVKLHFWSKSVRSERQLIAVVDGKERHKRNLWVWNIDSLFPLQNQILIVIVDEQLKYPSDLKIPVTASHGHRRRRWHFQTRALPAHQTLRSLRHFQDLQSLPSLSPQPRISILSSFSLYGFLALIAILLFFLIGRSFDWIWFHIKILSFC